MSTNRHCRNSIVATIVAFFTLVLLSGRANADSLTVVDHWQDNTVDDVYSSSSDSGTFSASLTIPGLSSFTAEQWSNLQVTISSADLLVGEDLSGEPDNFNDFMADAVNFGGTVTATSASFIFQLTDNNNNPSDAFEIQFSRSGNTLAISGRTQNLPALQPPWSILAWNYFDPLDIGASYGITDQVPFEITLQDASSQQQYADIQRTIFVSGTNVITYDANSSELFNIHVQGVADLAPPVLTSVSPAASGTVTNPVLTAVVRATDSAGVANVEFYLNGVDYGSGVSGASNLWFMSFALRPGTNVIQTQATDDNGNFSPTNNLIVTYVNRQTNASLLTFSEHWQDSAQTDYLGNTFDLSQDVGTLNAALPEPVLQGLSANTWSNLNLVLSFGDIDYSNSLLDANVLTPSNAVFYINTTQDANSNLVVETFLSVTRSDNNLVLAYETGNATYDFNYPIIADNYLGLNTHFQDEQPFGLMLLDGNTLNQYVNVSQPIYISGVDTSGVDPNTSNQLDNVVVSGSADFIPPTNQITAPISGQLWSNSVFTVTGKAGDNVGVAGVLVQVNGGGWNPATTGNNWTNWTVQVSLSPGTNSIQAYAVDAGGNISKTNTVSLVYVLSGVLTVNVGAGGTVSPNYNGALLELGKTYSMTAKANVGSAFTGWTGSLSTNSTVLTFLMASNLVFNANFADVQSPTNDITSPKPGQLWSNSVFTVTGKSGDNVAVANVFVSVNNGGWNPATPGNNNNWGAWTAQVSLSPGTNTIQAYAVDTSGNISKTNTVSLLYVLSAVLTVNVGTGGTVSPDYNGALLELGKMYSMTVKTNAGFAFTGWTGSITTNKTVLTFLMASNLIFNANFADVQPPTNDITSPKTGQLWSNSVFTVTGKSGDNVAVANVFVSVNSNGWNTATQVNNSWSNWTALVTLTPGTNHIAVYSVDTTENISKTNTVSLIYVLSAVLTVNVGTGGTVSPDYNGALLELGKMYSMTVKTNAGFAFTGWTGSITTNKTVLNFLMTSNLVFNANFADVQPPTNEITSPKPGQLWSNSVFTVTGKSGDNVAVSNVFVSVNNGGWTNATQVNNTWSNWTALVTLTPGTNHIAVYSVDTSENISKTNTVSLVYVLSAVLAVSTNGKGTITPNDNGALLQLGKAYSLTAGTVAGSGFTFTNWTGGTNLPLSVLTNKPVVQFIMQSNLMLQANFVYTNRPNLSITNPVAIERVSNTMFTVRGTASDKSGVSGVYYSLNGSGYTLASTGNGWTNWLVTVNLAMGTNNISVYAVNASNNLSVVKTAVIIRVPTAVVFPIATGDNIRHPQAKLAFDGTNYLVVYQVYPPGETNNSSAAGQFVSSDGGLVGTPLALNPNGQDDPPSVAFDGANYLVAWADYTADPSVPVVGVFVSPDGTVGTPGQISQSTTVDEFGTVVFGGGEYFLTWSDDRTTPDSLYGAMFSTSGTVLASDFLISTNVKDDISVQSAAAFDGTNFLAVWASATNKTSINGQLISVFGTLVGSPFVIYTNSTPAGQAAPNVTFDGTKYLVLFNVGLSSNTPAAFHVMGRFVTSAGEVMPNNITLTSDAGPQILAGAAFDGENYLVTWNQGLNPFTKTTTGVTINGRFMDDEGSPVTAEFPIFTTQDDRIPTWAPVLFDGTQYVLVTGLGQMVSPTPNLQFTNGIISGAIIAP